MKKSLIALGIVVFAVAALAATWSNTWTDGLFTGNGAVTTDIGSVMFGANQNGVVQISRNDTLDGGGQCSALDLYSSGGSGGCAAMPGTSVGGYLQRWFIPCATDGGKCMSMGFDWGGNLVMLGSITASGIVHNHNSTGQELRPIGPYDDGYELSGWSDMQYGAAIVGAGNPYSADGDPSAQAFIALDGHTADAGIGEYKPNVRFAIDGNSGKLRWSNSTANRYRDATWDATFGRISANLLGDPNTSIEALHFAQATGKHDIAGTISVVAANSGTITFNTAYTSAPVCVGSPTANMGGILWWMSNTTTTVKVNFSAVTTTTFNYHCTGNPN